MNPQPEIHRLYSLVPPAVPRHDVLRCIGSGSYGEVWLAKAAGGEYHAIKFVSRQTFQRDRPFEREFTGILKYEPISRSHEGFVDILQVGRDDAAAVFFYVMELGDDAFLGREIQPERYVPRTLRAEIDARGRLGFAECLRIAASLTSALGFLHEHGLVHRDIKPSNVIFVDGQAKLADIGLVADAHEARSYVGTEGFIPPEGPGTPQGDLFGLGKTIYEAATGRDRKEFPALPADLAGGPDHAGLLELNEVILKACANDPSKRYQSAAEMLSDLALLQSGRSVLHARALERRLQSAKKAGLVASAVAVVAAGAYFLADFEARRARQAEQTANEHLVKAYLGQARAGRLSGVPGQRVESLAAVAAASRLQPSLELRNEAVAALALFDVEEAYWRKRPVYFTENFAFDHALERYAVGDHQGEVRVYRAGDDQELMRLIGSRSPAGYLQFSPDGQFLAVNFGSTRLVIWNLATRKPVVNAKFGEVVWGPPCVFSPDGRTIGIRTTAPRIAFFDLTTGAELQSLPISAAAWAFALQPDGRLLAVVHQTNAAVWDVHSRTLHKSLPLPSRLESVAWHPDGRHLAVGDAAGQIYLWDTETQNKLELRGHTDRTTVLCFNHRGDVLVSSSWDGTTRFWDVSTGQQTLLTSGSYVVGFSPDDQRLAYTKEGSGFGIWRVHRSAVFKKLSPPIGSSKRIGTLDVSPDGRWLIAANPEGVYVWDLNRDRLIDFQSARDAQAALFAADGKAVVAASSRQLWVWPLLEQDDQPGFNFGPRQPLASLSASFFPSTLTGSARQWMTVHGLSAIWTVDLNHAAPRMVLQRDGLGRVAAISADTNWLATTQWKAGGTKVWDLRTQQMVRDLGKEGGHVTFSPDGRWLVVCSGAAYEFYETGTWRKRHAVRRDSAGPSVGQAAFSRDGRLMALAFSRRILQLVDPSTGRQIVSLIPPAPHSLGWLAFSPDDQTLMAATDQSEIQLWDLRQLRQQLAALNLDWSN